MAKAPQMIGEYTITGKPLGSGGMATVFPVSKGKKTICRQSSPQAFNS